MPPAEITGRAPSSAATNSARRARASDLSGAPDRPPACAPWREVRPSRLTVVLATISPASPASTAARAMPSTWARSRSGATFRNTGVPSAAAITPASSSSSPSSCKRAQAGRVGGRDVDREIVGTVRHRRRARRIVGDAVGRVLVRADVDAERASPPGALQPGECRRLAAVVEAHAVHHRAVLRQPEQARAGVAGLGRAGVSVPTSTAPKPAANAPRTATPSLSNPAASPTGLGQCSPAIVVARRGGGGGRALGQRPERSDGDRVRPLRLQRPERGPGEPIKAQKRLTTPK